MKPTGATKAKYPEHEKLKAREREASTLSSFIDFISEQGWELAEWLDDERLYSIRQRPDEIIGLFLGIDPKKLEKEKQAMLDEIRRANDATPPTSGKRREFRNENYKH